jgi:predicted transcriptional regulator
VRATDTLTISLPAAMAEQMKKVQKKENRTRSELLREAWRQYFDSHYGTYTPTKAELLAIRTGRAEVSRGEYRTLQEILNDLDPARRKAGRKTARKSSR